MSDYRSPELTRLHAQLAEVTSERDEVREALRRAEGRRWQSALSKAVGGVAGVLIGLTPTLLIIAAVAGLIYGIATCDGCAENARAGYVVSRDYHRPYTTTVCSGSKTRTCVPVYHPERFTVTIADGHHDESVVDMREDEWRHYQMGAWVCLDGEPCAHPHDDAATR